MTTIIRSTRLRSAASLFCAVAALAFLCAPAAKAEAADPVATQLEEVLAPVGQTVQSAQELGAAVTAPVQSVAGQATAAASEALPPASPPAAVKPSAPSTQAVPAASATASSAVAAAAGVVRATGKKARTAAAEAEGASAAATPAAVSTIEADPSATPDPSTADAGAPPAGAAGDPSATSTDDPPRERRTYVPAPTQTGATGAPLPRWVAYVWPAVALASPRLASLARDWSGEALHLAAAASADLEAGQGVAGVHASGGTRASGSSPLFTKIPAAIGHAFYPGATSALVYLGLLALAVLAVAIAVRREIALGRRR